MLRGEVCELGAVTPERARADRAHDHELRLARLCSVGDARERCVGAEVGDPPAAGAEREPERDQAEVVLLAGQAREQRESARGRDPSRARARAAARGGRSRRSAPVRSRRRRAPSARRARGGTGARPRVSSASTVATASSPSTTAWARGSSKPSSAVGELVRAPIGRRRPARRRVLGRRRSRRQRRRLGCGQSAVEVPLASAHALEVVERVETQPARRPCGLEQPVPALPCTQQLWADARAPAQLADAEQPSSHRTQTIQDLDNYLDKT